jgi:hypothetical protein
VHRNDKELESVPGAAVVHPSTSKYGSTAIIGTCVSPCICSLCSPSAVLSSHAPTSTSICSGEAVISGPCCSLVSSAAPRLLLRKLAPCSSPGFGCHASEPLHPQYCHAPAPALIPPWSSLVSLRIVLDQDCHVDDSRRTDGRTMAAALSETCMHCSVRYEVTWG